MIIAIDGPAGSGKTTVARLLAEKLGVLYLDTGATYRVLTLKAVEGNFDLNDEDSLALLADTLNIQFKGRKVFSGGKDVTEAIRNPRIDESISRPVSFRKVRNKMVNIQRNMARGHDVVVEGRDITTVVFPNADYKLYLDADIKERAGRRHRELTKKGIKVSLKDVERQMRSRDNSDFNREFGPLKKSPDAAVIDTTNLSMDSVLKEVISHIR